MLYIFQIGIAVASIFSALPIYRTLIGLNKLRHTIEQTDSISNRKESLISTIYRTARIVYNSCVIMVSRKYYGSVSCGKNFSYVSYFHNMKWYYFPIVTRKGPKKMIINAFDGTRNLTDFITKLAGPNVDFYGVSVRPRDIKSTSVTIIVDDETKTFNEDDVFVL